jgi:hypothetical protein
MSCHDTMLIPRGYRCGGAIGVYFVVKRCSLLYLYAGHGTFTQSPYLDVHGEVDVSMRSVRFAVMFQWNAQLQRADVVVVNTYTQPGGKKYAKRGSTTVFQLLLPVNLRAPSTVEDGKHFDFLKDFLSDNSSKKLVHTTRTSSVYKCHKWTIKPSVILISSCWFCVLRAPISAFLLSVRHQERR